MCFSMEGINVALEATKSSSRDIIVDMGDMKVVQQGGGRLATTNLGSCVAVAIHDSAAGVSGLVRFVLPESDLDEKRAVANPFLFADTAIPMLFRRPYKLGATKNGIVCHVVGGADVIDPDDIFSLGRHNHEKALEVLEANGVAVKGRHLGGTEGYSMCLNSATGKVVVTFQDDKEIEL